jgi:hypothetical protein
MYKTLRRGAIVVISNEPMIEKRSSLFSEEEEQ